MRGERREERRGHKRHEGASRGDTKHKQRKRKKGERERERKRRTINPECDVALDTLVEEFRVLLYNADQLAVVLLPHLKRQQSDADCKENGEDKAQERQAGDSDSTDNGEDKAQERQE